jgi:hypothetical protein
VGARASLELKTGERYGGAVSEPATQRAGDCTRPATIFAGLVQSQGLTEANEDQLSARAVVIAIKLAKYAEKLVKSDEEWIQKDGASSYLIG